VDDILSNIKYAEENEDPLYTANSEMIANLKNETYCKKNKTTYVKIKDNW